VARCGDKTGPRRSPFDKGIFFRSKLESTYIMSWIQAMGPLLLWGCGGRARKRIQPPHVSGANPGKSSLPEAKQQRMCLNVCNFLLSPRCSLYETSCFQCPCVSVAVQLPQSSTTAEHLDSHLHQSDCSSSAEQSMSITGASFQDTCRHGY
jgi:hypothetical protein